MSIISEFKERNIWSSLVVYLGGGWVVIEAFNFLTEKYQWPDIIIDFVIPTVIFGLPAVLIHSWYHGKRGKQRFLKKELFLQASNTIIYLVLITRLILMGDINPKIEIKGDKSIAVLPFKNLSNDQENQYFADGVIEAVRNHLGKIGHLWVTAGNTSENYRETAKLGSEIGTELGVKYILSGSIQRYENKIRISVELSDSEKNKQIWGQVYDRNYEDLFKLQSDIAINIASELNVELSPQVTSQINKRYTENLDAYNLYMEGQSLVRSKARTVDDLTKAEEIFKKAIQLDKEFSLAYVGLANLYLSHIMWGRTRPKEVISKAFDTIMKAMEIDNTMGETYQILGLIKFYQTDFSTAERHLNKAIELNPNYSESYIWLANIYSLTDRYVEATELFDKAIRLDPSAMNYRFLKSILFYNYGHYQLGINELESNQEIIGDTELQWVLGNLYYENGEVQKSLQIHRNRSSGRSTNWALGYEYGMIGEPDSAKFILNYLLEKQSEQYVPAYMIGCVYLGLGDKENAITWLQKSFDDGVDLLLIFGILLDPRLDSLREDPRFIALVDKIRAPK